MCEESDAARKRGLGFNDTLNFYQPAASSKLYRQIIGIPMDTYCAPLVAVLFLFCYERDFMLNLSTTKHANPARKESIGTSSANSAKFRGIRPRSTLITRVIT